MGLEKFRDMKECEDFKINLSVYEFEINRFRKKVNRFGEEEITRENSCYVTNPRYYEKSED